MANITKIVITGGPCGGKSTGLQKINDHFSNLGYTVVFINETATELIENGIAPWKGKNTAFQKAILKLQVYKEQIYHEWAKHLKADKILIVCDRGALDNKAYLPEEEFISILASLQANEIELRDQYDAVFHLVTAANGAAEYYTTANNTARTESCAEAVVLDNKVISAWTGHPHFRVIDNSTDFDKKIRRLISEIAAFLGEPEPFEIERKFLIRRPDLTLLENMPNCSEVDIIQTYLCSDQPNLEVRVRQRGKDGNYIYTETVKKRISKMKRVETERRITQREYLTLLMNADTKRRQIRKVRYCLTANNHYLEIDIFPFWQKIALLEIELSDENQQINLPDFIEVVREVTDDMRYTNRALAEFIPYENYAMDCGLSQQTLHAAEYSFDDSIELLELSTRSYNCLDRSGIKTISKLDSKTEEELMKIRNLGQKALEEILGKLNYVKFIRSCK